jgi:hypothetical protein
LLRAQHDHPAAPSPGQAADEPASTPDSMVNLAAMDGQLKALVAEMNQATGEAKITAMAKLLTALVEQRTQMREQMMTRMQGEMQDRGQMMTQMMQMMQQMQKMQKVMPEGAHGQDMMKKAAPETKQK